jgi:hypothetical protein
MSLEDEDVAALGTVQPQYAKHGKPCTMDSDIAKSWSYRK